MTDSSPMRRPLLIASLCVALVACSSGSGASPTSPAPTTTAPASTAPATTLPTTSRFTVQPGTEQIAVLGATPGETLHAIGPDGTDAGAITVDTQGSALWRNLTAGDGWHITANDSQSASVKVASRDDVPPADLYTSQTLLPAGGFGYITTRDGTTLSANVVLPGPADKEIGRAHV